MIRELGKGSFLSMRTTKAQSRLRESRSLLRAFVARLQNACLSKTYGQSEWKIVLVGRCIPCACVAQMSFSQVYYDIVMTKGCVVAVAR